jgi:hypothetical protein
MYHLYLFNDYSLSPSWFASPNSFPFSYFAQNHISCVIIVNGIVHLLVPLKLVIMKGGQLPNIKFLYGRITRSPMYDYTCILVKSLLYSSKYIHYCEYAVCCMTGGSISDGGRDFTLQCQVLTGLLSTAYHVVTMSVNIYVTFT